MRRISLSTAGSQTGSVSFEEHEIAAAMDGDELGVAIAENEPEVAAIDNDIHDAEALEEKAVSLEELAETADTIEAATPAEVQLVDLAANMGVAGTDEELEVFTAPEGEQVSVETFAGRRISTEGIKEMARDIWAAIKALIARAWEAILKFWRKITDQVPGVVKKARAMAQRAEDARGKTLKEKGDKTKLGAEGRRLVINDAAPKSAADIMKGIKALSEVADQFLTGHAKRIQTATDALATKMGSFDLEKPEESLKSMNATGKLAMKKADFSKLSAVTGDGRFGKDLAVLRSDYLPGNVNVFAETLSEKSDGSALGDSQHIRSAGVSVKASHEKPKEIKDFEMTTMSVSEVDALAGAIEELVGKVKKFNDSHLRGLEQAANKIKKSAGDVQGKIDDKTSMLALKCFNSAASYNTAVAKWSSSPFTQITSLIIAACNSAIVAGNKSLAQYK